MLSLADTIAVADRYSIDGVIESKIDPVLQLLALILIR